MPPPAEPDRVPSRSHAPPAADHLARRVTVVGPVWPFRGGIAQHTSMLCRALAGQCRIKVLSFSRQYPRPLFPGASDTDPTASPLDVGDVEFILDSVNPLSWRRAAARIVASEPDLVVIPWWTFFMAPCMGTLARACRRRGLRVRFLCHNTADHEHGRWKGALTHWALGGADSFATQTSHMAESLRRDHPGLPVLMHPHPIYDQFPTAESVPPRRAALELLFFGLVREYKGVDVLVDALARLADLDFKATIAGEFWWGRQRIEAQIAALGLTDRVELVPRYVSDGEAAGLFTRADAVILPYRNATGSGVIPLAYHYGKPVVVTRVGGLPDVVDEGRSGLIVAPDSPDDLAAAIRAVPDLLRGDVAGAIADLKNTMTWDGLARTLRAL